MNNLYFAFGSNMLESRLKKRLERAQFINIGKLSDFKFICNKKSINGSGKGNIEKSKGDLVWGVLYLIDIKDLTILDEIEKGYDRILVSIDVNGKFEEAFTYFSTIITQNPPTKKYLEYIIAGSKEHNLPGEYIQMLEEIIIE